MLSWKSIPSIHLGKSYHDFTCNSYGPKHWILRPFLEVIALFKTDHLWGWNLPFWWRWTWSFWSIPWKLTHIPRKKKNDVFECFWRWIISLEKNASLFGWIISWKFTYSLQSPALLRNDDDFSPTSPLRWDMYIHSLEGIGILQPLLGICISIYPIPGWSIFRWPQKEIRSIVQCDDRTTMAVKALNLGGCSNTTTWIFLRWVVGSKVVSTHLWNTPLNLYQQVVKGILS